MKDLVVNDTQTIPLEKTVPKIDAVLRIQGYKQLDKVRKTVRAAAQTAIDAFTQTSTPAVSYRVVDIRHLDSDSIVVGENVSLTSPIFQQYLCQAKQIVIFALTVGKGIDDQTIQWMEEEKLVEALFLESAAWLGVEDATKQFVMMVRSWAQAQHMRLSRRLGPGYSYPVNGQQVQWELHDQKPLFELFGEHDVPVSLLESAAMLPKMSRSGLYGLIPKPTPVC